MRGFTFIAGLIIVAACALAGCMPPRPSSDTAVQLARDAAPLLKLCTATQKIEPPQWPPSFTNAGVKSVYIGHEGLYMETARVYVQESGVFVPCDPTKFAADSVTGADPVYLKVAEGVFTYYIAG